MKPQVGAPRHSGMLNANWWGGQGRWRMSWPWWGYQQGWPWYGQQAQCFFDPWRGVWVCPTSPWVYQPTIGTWFQSPYFMGPISRPALSLGF